MIDENDDVVITGNTLVNQGDVITYNASTSSSTFFWNSNWSVSGGNTIQSQSDSFATIRWNNSGDFIVTFTADSFSGFIQGTLSVRVQSSGPTAPDAPPNPTVLSQNLDNTVTLQRNGNPPSGVTWYWQSTNPFGTSTSNSSSTYVATQTGRYYIKARNSDGLWSLGSGYIDVNITPLLTVWYEDSDFDGLGDPNSTSNSQIPPPGYVQVAGDDCPTIFGLVEHNGCPPPTVLDQNENYVYTIIPQTEVDEIAELNNINALENVTYFDGLGRAKQGIAIKQSASKNDIITHMEYDNVGRLAKEYLPYTPSSLEVNGAFIDKTTARNGTNSYYNSNYAVDLDTSNPNPFSEILFDAVLMDRPLKEASPGKDWRIGGGHEIEYDYETNSAGEVAYFKVNTTVGGVFTPSLVQNGTYAANQLFKNIIKDENHIGTEKNHTTEEFINKQGQVVLKRIYNNDISHDTYYVYDDFGNLTYIIPPKVNTSDGVSVEELSELCYQYVYDFKNRLIEKQLPGRGREYIVYNNSNLPILTQDTNLKAQNKWHFTKYDAFGRIIYTGFINSSNSRVSLQLDAQSSSYENKQYESKITGTGTIAGTSTYYTNNSFPNSGISQILTINYYDNYNFDTDGMTLPSTIYGEDVVDDTQGLLTGNKVRVLGTNDWIISLTGYDEKGRTIYTIEKNNYLMTTEIVESKLDFAGKVLETKTRHTNTNDNTLGTIVTVDKFYYDQAARLKRQTQRIGSNREEIIVDNTYDEIGQLMTKGVGGQHASIDFGGVSSFSENYLQEVDYRYNIRGWLKAINDPNVALGDKLFAFEINYNEGGEGGLSAPKLYNGNIGLTQWKTANDNIKRGYRYHYDDLNRITNANFKSGSNLDQESGFFQIDNINYDKNGNIETLRRNGVHPSTGNPTGMDNLTYTYDSGNKLLSVEDAVNWSFGDEGFLDGVSQTIEYEYDANGNMTKDLNKNITNITYNHLNLPVVVTFNSQEHHIANVNYVYDALGNKLSKQMYTAGPPNNVNGGVISNTVTTHYTGLGYIYVKTAIEDSTNPCFICPPFELKFINHNEGYVEPNDDSARPWKYAFQYKDQVNNIRLAYVDENNDGMVDASEIRSENNYYPFGLQHKGYNNVIVGTENNYQTFQGQEDEKELGKNTYAFQWRDYDPAIARFNKIDRFSEKYKNVSPYQFALNSPMRYTEIKGDSINLRSIQQYDKKNGTNYTQTIVDNLSEVSGLQLSADSKTGMLTYATDDDGNAIVNQVAYEDENGVMREGETTDGGSATARKDLISAIDNKKTGFARINNKSSAPRGGLLINIAPNQIDKFINGANNVNKNTLGYGMTFLHEMHHSALGLGVGDDKSKFGATGGVVDRMNLIRGELSNQSFMQSYGTRTSYKARSFSGGKAYLPMGQGSFKRLNGNRKPTTASQKFIEF